MHFFVLAGWVVAAAQGLMEKRPQMRSSRAILSKTSLRQGCAEHVERTVRVS